MGLTLGYQASVRVLAEVNEGAADDTAGKKLELLSDSVQSVKVALRTNRQVLYDISSAVGKGIIEGTQEFDVVVSFRWMDAVAIYSTTSTGILPDMVNRQSNGRLKTFTVEIAAAEDAATKTYLTCLGSKCDTAEWSLDEDGVWIVTLTLKPLTMTRSATLPVYTNISRPAVVVGSYFQFTGAIFESPAATPLAYAVGKAGFKVENNLQPVKAAGSTTVKTYAEGRQVVTLVGTEVTVEDGGKALIDATLAAGGSVADLVIKASSTANKPKITLKNVVIDQLDLEFTDDSPVVTVSPDRMATAGITLGVTP